jgi:hypothetical protein
MRSSASWFSALAICVLVGSALPARGQEDVTIDFTGVANPNVQTLGAYAGYYTGTITANGVTAAANPGFICDDYNNEIFLPSESWQATAISFASLATNPGDLSMTLFGNTIGLNGYAAIAYLSALMASASPSSQADIAAAIWYIGSIGTGTLSLSSLDAAAQALVTSLLGANGKFGTAGGTATAAAIAELEGSSLWIYTPTGQDINPSGDPFPQEFIANAPPGSLLVPEGGAPWLYLLLAASACCAAGALRYGRRPGALNRLPIACR